MSDAVSTFDQITTVLQPYGLVARGGFAFDQVSPPVGGVMAKSVVLVGHYGSSLWPHFREWQRNHPDQPNPLDAWSKEALNDIAGKIGAKAVFPSDEPYLPFQQWAKRAEGLRASPLGLLIHPEYGLWHAFRGALLFEHPIAFLPRTPTSHPCDSCIDKPCLSACPVGAFDGVNFAADDCRDYLATDEGKTCMEGGCLARLACPVGREYAYFPDQQRFHMAAFAQG